MKNALRVAVAFFLAALLPACGGSGGDGGSGAAPGPGGLVTDFGAGGVVLMDSAVSRGSINALAFDGTDLFAGGGSNPAGGGAYVWRVEKRKTSDGSLVPTFGTAGVVLNTSSGSVAALVVSGSSIFLVGGEFVGTQPMGEADFRWRIEKRSSATGALDGGFGTGGVVLSDPSPYADIPHAAVTDGTHLYTAGIDCVPETSGGALRTRWRIEKIRLDNGTPDAGFGTAGVVVIAQTTRVDEAFTLLLTGGALYAGGFQAATPTGQWRIEKRNPADGALDAGFGVGGAVLEDLSINHDEVKRLGTDGSALIVAGTVSGPVGGDEFWRVERRDLATGALIGTFGTAGAVEVDPSPNADPVEALAVDANGLYVMSRDSTFAFNNIQWRTEKRSPTTGALDAGFGAGGVLLGNPSVYNDLLLAALLDPSYLYLAGDQGVTSASSIWKIEKRYR